MLTKVCKLMYMKRVLLAFVLILSFFPNVTIANASGCPSGIWSNLYPGECILEYSDEAEVISGTNIRIQPDLLSCDYTFAGVKLSTGYDRISYLRLKSVPITGELTKNQTVNLELSLSENCRAWTKSYLANGEVVFQDGSKVSVDLSESNFRYREKFTGSIDSYCFTKTCGTATLIGSFQVPNSAQGAATLSLSISYNQASTSITQFSPIFAQYKYSGVLFVSNTATTPTSTNGIDANIPLTNVTMVDGEDGNITCYTADFTPSAISTYNIIGTRWRISEKNLAGQMTILDEYDWGLGVQANGDAVREYTTNGGKISLITGGTVIYAYNPRNVTKDFGYECSVAIRSKNSVGRFATEVIFAKGNTKDFNKVPATQLTPAASPSPKAKKSTITCTKGKLIKKVTAANPKCPAGYKKK
jgi:hypothetical protein